MKKFNAIEVENFLSFIAARKDDLLEVIKSRANHEGEVTLSDVFSAMARESGAYYGNLAKMLDGGSESNPEMSAEKMGQILMNASVQVTPVTARSPNPMLKENYTSGSMSHG